MQIVGSPQDPVSLKLWRRGPALFYPPSDSDVHGSLRTTENLAGLAESTHVDGLPWVPACLCFPFLTLCTPIVSWLHLVVYPHYQSPRSCFHTPSLRIWLSLGAYNCRPLYSSVKGTHISLANIDHSSYQWFNAFVYKMVRFPRAVRQIHILPHAL